MKSTVIGIAGGTGSGKSTFTNRLKDAFGDRITIIYHDNYYWPHDDVPFEERHNINYDHPDAFETDLLVSQLKELKAGHEVMGPVYDYTKRTRSDEKVLLRPSKVIIVEGILALQNDELRDLMDIKVFVEADADERILRRVVRDVNERGRDVQGIVDQYLSTVKPMHYMYVEPTKAFADIIINSGMNDVALDLVRSKIMDLLD